LSFSSIKYYQLYSYQNQLLQKKEQVTQRFFLHDQQFIWGPDLKEDLGKLNSHYDTLPSEVKEKGIMSFAGYPPKDRDSLVSKIWDTSFPEWRKRDETNYAEKNIKHDKIIDHVKKIAESPVLSSEEADFDTSKADSILLKRKTRIKKGSWFLIPKDHERKKPNEKNN